MFSEQANIIIKDIFKQCMNNLSLNWGNIDDESVYRNYKTESCELNDIFSKFHILLNKHFEAMNDKAKGVRNEYNTVKYNAQPSRELIFIIEKLKELRENLENENVKIELMDKYEKHISYCYNFLKSSYGSEIPEEYHSILLEKYNPIFYVKTKSSFPSVKYLIFGADKAKPDIIIRDVLDGKLDVVNDTDLLVYDGYVSDSFLYKDFNEWWEKVSVEKYRNYKNTLNSMEQKVADYYKNNFKKDDFPVLIPQVYLHYDPKNQKFRKMIEDGSILSFQRMDFLIIYKGKRVIIEIDGETHTPENNLEKYSKQCKYDRDMKFLGYDVFRLGGFELTYNFDNVIRDFFDKLLNYLNVNS